LSEIKGKTGLDEIDIHDVINSLEKLGYDIRRTMFKGEEYFILNRFADYSNKQFYRFNNEIETPVLVTADWHIGSKGFSEQAFWELVDDVRTFDIKHVLIAGDLLQGKGVHKLEALDLVDLTIESQIDKAVDYLNSIDVPTHVVIGNHEEKLKGKVDIGLDVLKVVSSRSNNVHYYGGAFYGKLNEKFSLFMIHGEGGPTYAMSYPVQKLYRTLIERPNLIVMGHYHILGWGSFDPLHYYVYPGTLQRENTWLLRKGITSTVGWIIVNEFSETRKELVVRTPEVF